MDMNCNKGEIMISVVSVEDKEQQYKSNSMKNEEAVRTLDADEEKSQTTSEIEQNQEGHAMPGYCDGITFYSKVLYDVTLLLLLLLFM